MNLPAVLWSHYGSNETTDIGIATQVSGKLYTSSTKTLRTTLQTHLTLSHPMIPYGVMVSHKLYGYLYGVFNTGRYTIVHGFCLFKLLLMGRKVYLLQMLDFQYVNECLLILLLLFKLLTFSSTACQSILCFIVDIWANILQERCSQKSISLSKVGIEVTKVPSMYVLNILWH